MIERLRELYRAPSPLAEEPALRGRMIEVFASVEMPMLLLPLAHNWAGKGFGAVAALALMEGVLLGVFWLNRRRRAVAAGRLLCFGNWAMITALCLSSHGGVHDVAIFAFPVLLMIAGMLFEFGVFVWFSLLVAGTVGALCLVEVRGWWVGPAGATRTLADAFDLMLIHGTAALVVALVARNIRNAFSRSRAHEAALRTSQDQLRKQAETLRASEQRLLTAMELAPEGVAQADAEGRIVQANSRAAEITGYPACELVGRVFTDFFSPAEMDRVPTHWERLDRGEIFTTERYLTRKDGSTILVEMTSQRLPDRTLQCFVRDVTGRQRREEQVRQTQRLEALGTLAGGVAHDFNNLLTVMYGALDAIDADLARPVSLKLPLLDLRSAAVRAGDLTQQLLAFARQQPLERRRMDFRTVIEQNARMVQRLIGPQIELAVACPAQPCLVLADSGMLTHVVLNLAVNARDAMPLGGRLELGVGVEDLATPPRLHGRDFSPGRYVCLRVGDTGRGMDEATVKRIFEPFYTTKERGKGTGLGLSVSLSVVLQHDGWIEVDSAPGRGTTFRVYLPALAGEAASPAAAEPVKAALALARGTETVLLVEDEEPVRRLAVGALQWGGFTVREAANGNEALEIWRRLGAGIDLLLTDVAMPGGLSGIEVAKAIRAQSPRLPVIVTSGYSQDSVEEAEGFWETIGFLPKPFTMVSLTTAVREALDRAK